MKAATIRLLSEAEEIVAKVDEAAGDDGTGASHTTVMAGYARAQIRIQEALVTEVAALRDAVEKAGKK